MQKMGILVKDMEVTKLPLSKYHKEKYFSWLSTRKMISQ